MLCSALWTTHVMCTCKSASQMQLDLGAAAAVKAILRRGWEVRYAYLAQAISHEGLRNS